MHLYRLAKWMEKQNHNEKEQSSRKRPETDGNERIDGAPAYLQSEELPMMKQAVERFQENVPHSDGKME